MERTNKDQVIAEVKQAFDNVMSLIVADFRGIDVETVTAIRRDFRANNCQYWVVKNTLVKIAVKDSPLAPMVSLLKGPSALIWSTESASTPAKLAIKHAKEHDKFVVKGGYFDGQALDAAGVERRRELNDGQSAGRHALRSGGCARPRRGAGVQPSRKYIAPQYGHFALPLASIGR
jgi:large subunit ribosomal protein L10